MNQKPWPIWLETKSFQKLISRETNIAYLPNQPHLKGLVSGHNIRFYRFPDKTVFATASVVDIAKAATFKRVVQHFSNEGLLEKGRTVGEVVKLLEQRYPAPERRKDLGVLALRVRVMEHEDIRARGWSSHSHGWVLFFKDDPSSETHFSCFDKCLKKLEQLRDEIPDKDQIQINGKHSFNLSICLSGSEPACMSLLEQVLEHKLADIVPNVEL